MASKNIVTREQLEYITMLNALMENNQYFRSAISYDSGVRNAGNIHYMIKVVELYNYLYKHLDLIPAVLLKGSKKKEFDMHLAYDNFNRVHMSMCTYNLSAAKAINNFFTST